MQAQVLFLGEQGLLYGQPGLGQALVAACGRKPQPVGQPGFQLGVLAAVPVGLHALARGPVLQGTEYLEMPRQTQVIRAGEIKHRHCLGLQRFHRQTRRWQLLQALGQGGAAHGRQTTLTERGWLG